jgi:hypothetical protein
VVYIELFIFIPEQEVVLLHEAIWRRPLELSRQSKLFFIEESKAPVHENPEV